VIELSDGDTEDEEDKKPSAVEESNKPPFGSSKKKPPSERRASKGARNGKSKSPYASTPTNELVGTYCAAVSSKGWGDIFVHDMADELRTRLLDDEQFDRLKQATIDGLLAAAQRVETGDITPPRMDAYCAKIRVYCAQIRSVKPAKRGQKLNVFMLLCPKWIKGQLISLCPYATPVPGFDPNSCSTTRVLRKLTDELDEDEYTTDDVRGDCQCEDGRCKKCTKDEGSARAEVYNRFALFFYVTGGEMSFYNLGGTTTRIKENLVSKLDRHYFHTVFKNGYHLSCATYLVPCFPTFEYGATCITANMKEACDLLQIPQAIVTMITDDDIPMIVDPEQMAHHKTIWEDGLTRDNDNEGDIKSWKAENEKRKSWLIANANCPDSILSDSVPKYVLPYVYFFEGELLERNRVDSLQKVTVSMVHRMQSSHGGSAKTEAKEKAAPWNGLHSKKTQEEIDLLHELKGIIVPVVNNIKFTKSDRLGGANDKLLEDNLLAALRKFDKTNPTNVKSIEWCSKNIKDKSGTISGYGGKNIDVDYFKEQGYNLVTCDSRTLGRGLVARSRAWIEMQVIIRALVIAKIAHHKKEEYEAKIKDNMLNLLKTVVERRRSTIKTGKSLEEAAASGCKKCTKELNTGEKTRREHCDQCPRKQKTKRKRARS